MYRKPFLLLSFDVEEFDMPLEYGQLIPEKEQLQVGYQGLEALMNVVDAFEIEATFFTTANFAQHFPEAIKNISTKHEIASHTFYHSRFHPEDLISSKRKLEEIISKPVSGLRMPRMRKVEMDDVKKAGYSYDSSINPSFVPGRYNNLSLPKRFYYENEVLRFPVSVSPIVRIPLFWLSFKNFPYQFYLHLVKRTLKKEGYVCLYFHPWEFVSLSDYKIPSYAKRLAGEQLQQRLKRLITDIQPYGKFISMQNYISNCL
ncbi:MAG: polysaccharide deacetylase family protein [Flavisolibacter sp.]|nr:polysaccharide deacetylase family protein [Flavisolibacter sp.]